MKRIHLILMMIYLFTMFYFAVFNWEIFVVNLNISLGLAVVQVPLIMVFFISGLVLLLIEWGVSKILSLKAERVLSNKSGEIVKIKAARFDSQQTENPKNFIRLEELNSKLDLVLEKLNIEQKEKKKTNILAESNVGVTDNIGLQD